MNSQRLETMTWTEAESALRDHNLLLVPVGARCKEHGHHLPLNTDWLLAEYLTQRVSARILALVLPTLQYGYYPAFLEYPGSVHVQRETFQATVCDICRSLARHSSAKFYVLNTGIGTNWALEPARRTLENEGIVMEYTDLTTVLRDLEERVREEPTGTHADEIETSIMLYAHPKVVQLEKARRDIHGRSVKGPLTRDPNVTSGIYSPSGAWGDPTLATREKGEIIVESFVDRLVHFLERFVAGNYIPEPLREKYLSNP